MHERPRARRRLRQPLLGDVEHLAAVVDADRAPESSSVPEQHLPGAASEVEHRLARHDAAVERSEQEIVREDPGSPLT
jgi:hypothetical protein